MNSTWFEFGVIHIVVAYLFGMICGMIVALTLLQHLVTNWRKQRDEEEDPANWWKHGNQDSSDEPD